MTDDELIAHVERPDAADFGDLKPEYLARLITLARRGAAVKWRKIEEAKKDGSDILLCCPERDVIKIGYWSPVKGKGWMMNFGPGYTASAGHLKITNFIPLSAFGKPEET